jgi:hypothetical protein
MEKRDKSGQIKEDNKQALEVYFDRIRDYIEQRKEIDSKLKAPLAQTFNRVLTAFNEYERELLVMPKNKPQATPTVTPVIISTVTSTPIRSGPPVSKSESL